MEEDNNRFRVYGKADKIELHGAISDTSDFGPIAEMVKDNNVLDCSGLTSASWLGLIGLDRFLVETAKKFSFIRFPGKIYKFFRLLPGVNDRYNIEDFQLEMFDLGTLEGLPESYQASRDQLVALNDGSQNVIIAGENRAIDGFLPKLLPELFSVSNADPSFMNKWYRENSAEAYFWINLLSFWDATLGLSLDMVSAQRIGLNQLLKRVITRVESAEVGFGAVGEDVEGLSESLRQIVNSFEKECLLVEVKIQEVLGVCEKARRRLQCTGDSLNGHNGEFVYEKLNFIANAIRDFSLNLNDIERVSYSTGEKILELFVYIKLKEALENIDGQSLSPNSIKDVRKGFNILDPFSDGSWDDTVNAITTELGMIQADLGQCVVLFQGFDLLRQVLEHRVKEAVILTESTVKLQGGEISWLEVQTEVYEQIIKTLVTDQEKYAFAFFLPDGYDSYDSENNQAPGEMVLF